MLNYPFNKTVSFFKTNLLIGCSYFVLGWFGLLLFVESSQASLIWPTAGLALAAFLVYGASILLGLLIGAFSLEFYLLLNTLPALTLEQSLAFGVIIAVGACLQASFGAFLINRIIGKNDPLIEDRKIFYFFFYGALISSMVAPTINTASHYFIGAIDANLLHSFWAIKWLGNIFGIIIFTPIVLTFINKPGNSWHNRRQLVAYPLLIFYILIFSFFQLEKIVPIQIADKTGGILLGGLIIASLIAIGLLMLTSRTLRAEQLFRARTKELTKSEERWQFALEGSQEGVWDWNLTSNEIYFSSRFKEMLGYQEHELNNDLSEWDKRIHPEDRDRVYIQLNRYLNHDAGSYENEYRLRCKDNSYIWILTRGKIVAWTEDHDPLRMIGTHMDITERKNVEEQLMLSARVFNETNEGITITDTNGNIMDVNPAFCKITGYSRHEIINQNPRILNSGKHDKAFYAEMWESLGQHGHWQGEVWNRKKDGSIYAELLSISSIFDDNGNASHYIGIFTDITQTKKQQEILEQMAHYDVLTQLPNRVLLADRFDLALAQCKRNHTELAVCFLDLDNFKPVNDMYGHELGDELLIEVAKRIKSNIREEDTVSRHGGDEFVLLLGNLEGYAQCETLLNRILNSLIKAYNFEGHTISISASIGVSFYPRDNADLDTLMRHADQAMYQAKLSGRNRFHLFNIEQDHLYIQKNIKLTEINRALIDNEFSLHYQPKVNMNTGHVYGAEALIRWNHPKKGLIPPLEFLPVIEGSELEIEVGRWVINRVLKQLDFWNTQGINIEVSINISSNHLQHSSFITDLESSLALFPNVDSKSVQLEILESSALGDLESISRIIKTCIQALGVKVALDDFGTGYSSLTHLRNLPADTIKIDQSFVRDLLDDPNDYNIINGVIGLADAFNRQVIAEGVESREHGIMLITMGCHLAQGYVISKPMPPEGFQQWLNDYEAYQEWMSFAKTALNERQSIIKIFKLTLRQWHHNFASKIRSFPEDNIQWPILNETKCHCGASIEQIKQLNIFEKDRQSEIENMHKIMHRQANELFSSYQNGQIEFARKNLADFAEITEQLNNLVETSTTAIADDPISR